MGKMVTVDAQRESFWCCFYSWAWSTERKMLFIVDEKWKWEWNGKKSLVPMNSIWKFSFVRDDANTTSQILYVIWMVHQWPSFTSFSIAFVPTAATFWYSNFLKEPKRMNDNRNSSQAFTFGVVWNALSSQINYLYIFFFHSFRFRCCFCFCSCYCCFCFWRGTKWGRPKTNFDSCILVFVFVSFLFFCAAVFLQRKSSHSFSSSPIVVFFNKQKFVCRSGNSTQLTQLCVLFRFNCQQSSNIGPFDRKQEKSNEKKQRQNKNRKKRKTFENTRKRFREKHRHCQFGHFRKQIHVSIWFGLCISASLCASLCVHVLLWLCTRECRVVLHLWW